MKLRNTPFRDITGLQSGKLTVVRPIKICVGGRNETRWVCNCACGSSAVIKTLNVLNGRYKSCGCGRIKHGKARKGKEHPLYRTWAGMFTRCSPTSCELNRKNYYLRGIRVCPRWHDVDAFIEDMMPSWSEGLSLDRKDNDLGYFKDNCRWVPRSFQNGNQRRNTQVATPSGTFCVMEAVRLYGVHSYGIVRRRIRKGMDPWLALSTP